MVWYPSVDKVVEFNVLALSVVKAKRADSAKVLSRAKIAAAIDSCAATEGDVFAKAAVLLKGLVQAHAFASGNRRTAFLVAKCFLLLNNQKLGVADNPENAKVLLGVRENRYSIDEIRGWLEHGKIKEFKR